MLLVRITVLREYLREALLVNRQGRQEIVSPLFEMLRDDNVRRLCNSFVGANGRSPEKGPGWNLCLLREKWDIRDLSVPLFNYSQSTLNAFARCYAQAITRNAPLNRGIGGFEGFLARTKIVLISELVLRSELNVQVAKKRDPIISI